MTPEQSEEFKSYGCGCRCLIALSNAAGKKITKEQFIDRFSSKYPEWEKKKQCGVTSVGMIFDIARELGLANNFTVFQNKDMIRDGVRKKMISALILVTEKRLLEDGKTWQEYYHCALASLALPSDSSWLISQVDQSMNVLPPQEIRDGYIDQMSGYFLVLMP